MDPSLWIHPSYGALQLRSGATQLSHTYMCGPQARKSQNSGRPEFPRPQTQGALSPPAPNPGRPEPPRPKTQGALSSPAPNSGRPQFLQDAGGVLHVAWEPAKRPRNGISRPQKGPILFFGPLRGAKGGGSVNPSILFKKARFCNRFRNFFLVSAFPGLGPIFPE